MPNVEWRDRIVSTPDVLRGKPRLKDTRVPVSLAFGFLASGYSTPDLIAELPDLMEDDVVAGLGCARDLSEFEVSA